MLSRIILALLAAGLSPYAALGVEGVGSRLEAEVNEHSYTYDFSRISERTPVELVRALADIDGLCYGENPDFKPDFEEVDRRTEALLRQYTGGEDRGLIFFNLARNLIQCVFKRPDMTIRYAQQALNCPIGPAKKMQMYQDWGQAIQIQYGSPHGDDWPPVRRDILMKYLQVLKLGLDYGLPDERQEPPTMTVFTVDGPDEEYLQKLRRKNADQMQARNLVMYANEMIETSRSTVDCIGWLYYYPPLDVDELRSLAMEVLNDENLVNRLVAAAQKNVDIRVKHETGLIVETAVDEITGDLESDFPQKPQGENLSPPEETGRSTASQPPQTAPTETGDAAAPSQPRSYAWVVAAVLASAALAAALLVLLRAGKPRAPRR